MSQFAYPLSETRITATVRLACDRCAREIPFGRQHINELEGWVCCHKLVSNDAHTPQTLPTFGSVEDAAVRMPNMDELHVCPDCWKVVEAAVQPTKPAAPPAGVHHDIGSLCTLPHCPHPHRPMPVVGSGRYA